MELVRIILSAFFKSFIRRVFFRALSLFIVTCLAIPFNKPQESGGVHQRPLMNTKTLDIAPSVISSFSLRKRTSQ